MQAPYLGTYYYLINTKRPPVDDVRVRQALALSVDREKLVRTVLQERPYRLLHHAAGHGDTSPKLLTTTPSVPASYWPRRATRTARDGPG